MIAWLKFLHIAALLFWCGGLLLLPLLLARADNPVRAGEAARMRIFAHFAYNFCVSPAAVVATIAGGSLLFARWVFEPWMFVKLVQIGALVVLHTYLGHCVARLGEAGYVRPAVPPALMLGAGLAIMGAILVTVLAKPHLDAAMMPDWLRQPLNRQLLLPPAPSR
ncbi:putative membrane protein [Bosea sp. OAE506]|uniref:CopD family protein n=1 Tax=Bosea sp. OAE506 TaxID=2663870 RepID=UPI001788FA04